MTECGPPAGAGVRTSDPEYAKMGRVRSESSLAIDRGEKWRVGGCRSRVDLDLRPDAGAIAVRADQTDARVIPMQACRT